ncbi:MAG: hypothetical protein AB7F64_02975 [Gammaproteobacteria bacterium]
MAKKSSRLNAESLAIILALVFALPLAFIHPSLVNIITYPAQFLWMFIWVAQTIAGGAFLARIFDFAFTQTPPNEYLSSVKKINWNMIKSRIKNIFQNKFGEFLGFLIGLVVSIYIIDLQLDLTLASFPMGFLTMIFFVGAAFLTLNRILGFLNRTSKLFDFGISAKKENNFWQKKEINYILSICAGLIIGALLISAVFSVLGVATAAATVTVICGLTGVPAMLIFSLFALSTVVSATSNTGRWFDLLLGKRTLVGATKDLIYGEAKDKNERFYLPRSESSEKETFKYRFYENKYESTFVLIGVPLGYAAGVGLSVLLLTGMIATSATFAFMFGATFPAALAVPFIMCGCVGVISGFARRIGMALDHSSGELAYQRFGQEKKEKPKQYVSVFDSPLYKNALTSKPEQKGEMTNLEKPKQASSDSQASITQKSYAYAYKSAGLWGDTDGQEEKDTNPFLRKLLGVGPVQKSARMSC